MNDSLILSKKRSEVRYILYRIRTAVERGEELPSEVIPYKKHYEKQKGFTSWKDFARIWDVDEEGKHDRIIRRSLPEEEEWAYSIIEYLKDFPVV